MKPDKGMEGPLEGSGGDPPGPVDDVPALEDGQSINSGGRVRTSAMTIILQ